MLDTVGSRDKAADRHDRHVPAVRDRSVQDEDAILDSARLDLDLTDETSDLLVGTGPSLIEDIKQLRNVATNLKQEPRRSRPVDPDPADQAEQDRPHGDLGREFNFYLCEFQGRTVDRRCPSEHASADRCHSPERDELDLLRSAPEVRMPSRRERGHDEAIPRTQPRDHRR